MGKLIQFKKVLVRERKPRRLTPEVLTELLMVHSCCADGSAGQCPMLLSVKSLCWEINRVQGTSRPRRTRVSSATARCAAARPLNRIMECYCEEEPE